MVDLRALRSELVRRLDKAEMSLSERNSIIFEIEMLTRISGKAENLSEFFMSAATRSPEFALSRILIDLFRAGKVSGEILEELKQRLVGEDVEKKEFIADFQALWDRPKNGASGDA